MAKGRPADPTRARRGTGHRQQRTSGTVDVVATPVGRALPAPPDDLPEPAKELFRRAVAELSTRGLREVDGEAIAMMCWSAYIHADARANIARTGTLVKGPRGPMVNPLIKIARDEAANYMRLADAFGLTLASRLRLGLMQLAGESLLAALNDDLDTPDVSIKVNL